MFDNDRPGSIFAAISPPADVAASPAEPARVPLERVARAHRQVTAAGDTEARVRRRLTWRFEEDGSLSGTFRLPPLQGAVLLKALRAACADLAGDPPADVSAETPAAVAAPAAETP